VECADNLQRGLAVVGDAHICANRREQSSEAVRGIVVVVHDENSRQSEGIGVREGRV
jgi:hypothetical protein